MNFSELTEEQRLELKQRILIERLDARGESPSYGYLVDADDLVSDEDLEDWYGDTVFSPDDFFCSEGEDDPESRKRAKDFLARYLDVEDTYGASDFIEDITSLSEESSGTEFGRKLAEIVLWYDSDTGLGPEKLAFRIDSLLNGDSD